MVNLKLYKKKDYLMKILFLITILLFNITIADTFSEISSKAMNGDISAEKLLAKMYRNGKAGIIDDSKAFLLYQSAAKKNDPEAQYLFGELLILNESYSEGIEQITLSANQGYKPAIHILGIIYEDGLFGITQNYNESFKWYEQLAKAGDNKGYFLLGFMYEHGLGTKKDIKTSNILYQKACDAGYKAKCS